MVLFDENQAEENGGKVAGKFRTRRKKRPPKNAEDDLDEDDLGDYVRCESLICTAI